MRSVKSILAAAAIAMAAAPGFAATIVNGSFEDIGGQQLNNRGWKHLSDVPGWTGDSKIEIQSNNTLGSINAHDGIRYVELDTNRDEGIYQDVDFTAGTYLLSFFYSPRVNATPTSTNDMRFAVGSLASGSIMGAPNPSYPHGTWTEVTATFTVPTNQTVRLSFFATGGSHHQGCGNCGALIDSVSISPVPLPAGAALFGSALLGLGLLRRRRA